MNNNQPSPRSGNKPVFFEQKKFVDEDVDEMSDDDFEDTDEHMVNANNNNQYAVN